jgi:hypothetical protein
MGGVSVVRRGDALPAGGGCHSATRGASDPELAGMEGQAACHTGKQLVSFACDAR